MPQSLNWLQCEHCKVPWPLKADPVVIRSPTSGGQYHWVSEFAPPKAQKMLSYAVGTLPSKVIGPRQTSNIKEQAGSVSWVGKRQLVQLPFWLAQSSKGYSF
jgi:hypothetical protein